MGQAEMKDHLKTETKQTIIAFASLKTHTERTWSTLWSLVAQ